MIDEALLRPGRLEVKMEIGEHQHSCVPLSLVVGGYITLTPCLPVTLLSLSLCPSLLLPFSFPPSFLSFPLPFLFFSLLHFSALSLSLPSVLPPPPLQGLPNENGRLEILHIHTAQMQNNKMLSGDIDLPSLAKKTRNFSGAEIEGLVRSAQSTAMNKMIKVHLSWLSQ